MVFREGFFFLFDLILFYNYEDMLHAFNDKSKKQSAFREM